MPEQGVKRSAGHLAAVLHIEIRLIRLDVGEARIPFGLLNTAKLFTLNFSNALGGFIGEHVIRGQFRQRGIHRGGKQFLAQAGRVLGATVLGHPG